jgi:uncharacterized GH25 family protein
MRKPLVIVMTCMLACPALAHDFWIQPLRFAIAGPGPVPMQIFVGHGAAKERWGQAANRVVLFSSIGPDGLVDRKPSLRLGAPGIDALVPLSKPGTYVFAFQSTASSSDLPFLRFNDYVAAEGITPIAAHRARTGTERTNGRELYSRRAKAIVDVGAIDAEGIARATRPVGLSLEIVPGRHPRTVPAGAAFPVRVVYHGKPLAGALVKLTNLEADDKPVATVRSDRSGRASFPMPPHGSWQFNVVWADVKGGNPTTTYVTTFSSLTFGT